MSETSLNFLTPADIPTTLYQFGLMDTKKDTFCKRAPTLKLQKQRKSTDKRGPSSFLRNSGKNQTKHNGVNPLHDRDRK